MSDAYLIAAGRIVDGAGTLDVVEDVERRLTTRGIAPTKLVIDPLDAGWDTPIAPNHFRSGCAPVEALSAARDAIAASQAEAVVISGEDALRTKYQNDKARRTALMAIYGEATTVAQTYTELAFTFMRQRGIDDTTFRQLAAALYENYTRTAERMGRYDRPPAERFERVTELFRAVDCANPVTDFQGRLLVASKKTADALDIPAADRIRVAGVGLARTAGDGPAHTEEIAQYAHLRIAYRIACEQARVDFAALFRSGRALLEAYTCFPVAPLGFLLASGIAESAAAIPDVLARHDVTVTGGMNIARAAWNNPALNALVAMYDALRIGAATAGAVHGNGGLGYRQGVAILLKS